MGLLLGSVACPTSCMKGEKMVTIQSKQARFLKSFESISDALEDGDLNQLDGENNIELSKILERIPTSSPTIEELSKGSAFSFKSFLRKLSIKKPASQMDLKSLASKGQEKLKKIEIRRSSGSESNLVSTHYFHAEIQFIKSLVDISERLVTFPKFARQPSLIAELTLINHNLPANVCIPFWCPFSSMGENHHQIVQIALSDCVVLNSSERVWFY
jgi:phosphatidylinositol 4-kinase